MVSFWPLAPTETRSGSLTRPQPSVFCRRNRKHGERRATVTGHYYNVHLGLTCRESAEEAPPATGRAPTEGSTGIGRARRAYSLSTSDNCLLTHPRRPIANAAQNSLLRRGTGFAAALLAGRM